MNIANSENLNVPNGITTARLVGVVYEAIRYARTGEMKHLLHAGGYFMLDTIDGPAARALHQETEFGAGYDPFVDKASFAVVAGAAALQGEIDTPVFIATGAINASNVIATLVAQRRNVLDMHAVGRDNKNSQFGMNVGAGFNIIGNNLEKRARSDLGRTAGTTVRHLGTAIGTASAATSGIKATIGLWRKALSK